MIYYLATLQQMPDTDDEEEKHDDTDTDTDTEVDKARASIKESYEKELTNTRKALFEEYKRRYDDFNSRVYIHEMRAKQLCHHCQHWATSAGAKAACVYHLNTERAGIRKYIDDELTAFTVKGKAHLQQIIVRGEERIATVDLARLTRLRKTEKEEPGKLNQSSTLVEWIHDFLYKIDYPPGHHGVQLMDIDQDELGGKFQRPDEETWDLWYTRQKERLRYWTGDTDKRHAQAWTILDALGIPFGKAARCCWQQALESQEGNEFEVCMTCLIKAIMDPHAVEKRMNRRASEAAQAGYTKPPNYTEDVMKQLELVATEFVAMDVDD